MFRRNVSLTAAPARRAHWRQHHWIGITATELQLTASVNDILLQMTWQKEPFKLPVDNFEHNSPEPSNAFNCPSVKIICRVEKKSIVSGLSA